MIQQESEKMNSQYILLSILFLFFLTNICYAFATTENFLVLPDNQKTFDIVLNENHKVFFQIFVKGGENDDIRLKIIDSDTDFVYFNSILRAQKHDTEYDSIIFPAYKSEINNPDTNTKKLIFIFDNSLSTSSSKTIDFTYNVFTESGTNFEQTALWSWVSTFVIIVILIISVIIVIVMVLRKLKKRANK
jgi:hypothetical protein